MTYTPPAFNVEDFSPHPNDIKDARTEFGGMSLKDDEQLRYAIEYCIGAGLNLQTTGQIIMGPNRTGDSWKATRQKICKLYGEVFDQNPAWFGKGSSYADNETNFSFAALADEPAPPQSWLVNPWLPADDVSVIQGDGGVGKTTFGLQLVFSLASGRDWLGLPTVAEPSSAVFVSVEEGLKVRGVAACVLKAMGLSFGEVPKARLLILNQDEKFLAELDADHNMQPSESYNHLRDTIQFHKPRVVVIDSLVDVYPFDENNRQQVRQFMGLLRQLAGPETAIVVLGHPSLAGIASGKGTSGSTAWRNAFRSMVYVTMQAGDVHRLKLVKSNYGKPGATLATVWQDGMFVPIADAVDTVDTVEEANRATECDFEFLELLKGRNVTTKPTAYNYAPTSFAKLSTRFNRADFERAMLEFLDAGIIRVVDYKDSNYRKRQRLEHVEGAF